ncbi:MAG: orotidine-5'-phosphate decarboxylase [Methanoregulaceae archaeon]
MTELVLALDVTEKNRAIAVAQACAPHIDCIKLGYPLILRAGLSIARDLASLGLPLIADFKVADIPNTNRLITDAVFDAGFSGIICQGFTGRDSVQACVDGAHARDGSCYVVAEMSHPGAPEFFHGGVAERLAELAVTCGADGIIAPATRPDRVRVLREIVGSRRIYSPGVGAQGGDADAVAPLVDGIIIGRAIYESDNPAAAAKTYARIRA